LQKTLQPRSGLNKSGFLCTLSQHEAGPTSKVLHTAYTRSLLDAIPGQEYERRLAEAEQGGTAALAPLRFYWIKSQREINYANLLQQCF